MYVYIFIYIYILDLTAPIPPSLALSAQSHLPCLESTTTGLINAIYSLPGTKFPLGWTAVRLFDLLCEQAKSSL